jgi:predicted nuclease with TOPRIM domain
MNNLEDIKLQISNLEKLILKKFDEIDKKLDEINEKLDTLIEYNNNNDAKINEIKIECKKMGSHINFIEDTYNVLQTPLNYVKRSVERLIGSSNGELKNLPIKDTDKDTIKDTDNEI